MIIQQSTLVNQKPSPPPQAYMHIPACMVGMARVYTEDYQEPLHTHTPLFSVSCIGRIFDQAPQKKKGNYRNTRPSI